MYLITSTLLPTPEGTSGALLTHLSHGRLSKTVWVKYSQSWTPPPTPQRGIWGCPKGYQIGPLMKALFIHSHISIQNLPSLCPSLRIKLLWQEEPPNWGKEFLLMWSVFQRTQLLTILVNEIVLRSWLLRPKFITGASSSLSFSSGLSFVLVKSQIHSFGLAHSLSWQPSNHLQTLPVTITQGTSKEELQGRGPRMLRKARCLLN